MITKEGDYRKTYIYNIVQKRQVIPMRGKKGQAVDAGNASLLILVILIVIVLYVLLVSPETREELLENGDNNGGNGGDGTITEGEILLEEYPGKLDFIEESEREHPIPSFYLYKTTDSEELKKINPFYIKSTAFEKKNAHSINFEIENLENTENVMLSFQAPVHKGVLTITLNGQEIFSAALSSRDVEPVSLSDDLLQEENVLEFSVEEVGWAFWTAHEYSIENVWIIGDVTDVSRQEAKNSFYLTEAEYNNVERALLKFSPDCRPETAGKLEVYINNMEVFSGIPDCGSLNIYEFSPEFLTEGANRVIFKTSEGNYLVDLISVKTELKESPSVVYYFEIEEEDYEDIVDDLVDVELSIVFVDSVVSKEADIFINGRRTRLSTWEGE